MTFIFFGPDDSDINLHKNYHFIKVEITKFNVCDEKKLGKDKTWAQPRIYLGELKTEMSYSRYEDEDIPCAGIYLMNPAIHVEYARNDGVTGGWRYWRSHRGLWINEKLWCDVTAAESGDGEMRRCGVWTLGHDVIIVTAELTISHLRLLNTDTGTEDRLVKLTPMPKIYTSSG